MTVPRPPSILESWDELTRTVRPPSVRARVSSRTSVPFGALATAAVVIAVLALLPFLPTEPPGSTADPTASASPTGTDKAPQRTPRFIETQHPSEGPVTLFDGTIHGWRFAPTDVLRAAGFNGEDPRDCEAQEYGATHPTDLDFGVAYLPSGPRSEQVTKSACDDRAYFVTREITFEETGGYLHMTRVLSGSASFPLEAPTSLVEPCQIADRPAVCVHYLDDTTGRGGHLAQIIILEQPALDPYGVVFRLAGGEMPFAELVKIASSVSFE
jgi:hypothetical protein